MATISQANDNSARDEITLKDLLSKIVSGIKYLLTKWHIFLFMALLGGLLGLVYVNFKKPTFTATTTFVLEEAGGKGDALGGLSGFASIAGIDLGGGSGGIFQGENIIELYKSRNMIEKTLFTAIINNGKEELLINRYIAFNELRKKWTENSTLATLEFAENKRLTPNLQRLRDSVVGVIVKDVKLNYLMVSKPDKKLNIIKADVKAKDELFAKFFNEEIVKNVNEFYVQTKTKKSLDNITILQTKTDSVRNVMNSSIYNAAAVGDATPNLNPTRLVQRTAPIQRSQFSAETNKAILSELVKNLEMSKMNLLRESPLIQVIDQPVLPLEKDELGYIKGVVLGGILGGFLLVLILIIRYMFKNV